MKEWVMELCPEIQEWQAEVIAEYLDKALQGQKVEIIRDLADIPLYGNERMRRIQHSTIKDCIRIIKEGHSQ